MDGWMDGLMWRYGSFGGHWEVGRVLDEAQVGVVEVWSVVWACGEAWNTGIQGAQRQVWTAVGTHGETWGAMGGSVEAGVHIRHEYRAATHCRWQKHARHPFDVWTTCCS